MHKTFWLKRRQRSRLDATSALRGVVEVRGNTLGDDVVPAGRLVIMRVPVKIL
jgi:hypothetical protein